MFNICLIGFGNIGRRHFEALLKLKFDVKIFLVDPYEQAFKNINDYSLTSNINVEFLHDYDFLPVNIDLAIIATSSSVRRMCFEKLVKKSIVKYIIFEKVLFQKIEDYDYVEDELNRRSIKAWVNCPRRLFDSYCFLRDELSRDTIESIKISGGNWGLGCNGIHMLDLISYLVYDVDLRVDIFTFGDQIFDSKRSGYKEFYGSIQGSDANNRFQFEISCDNSSDSLCITIDTVNYRYVVCEKDNVLTKTTKNTNASILKKEFSIDYVSYTTKKAVDDIICNGKCLLTSFTKSKEIHLKFIKCILDYYGNKLGDKNICPIT